MGLFSRKNKNTEDEEYYAFIDIDDSEPELHTTLPSHALTPEEVTSGNTEPPKVQTVPSSSPLESLKKRMHQTESPEHDAEAKPHTVEESKPTNLNILDRVRAYTIDEDGNNAAENTDPIYQLESVAEIIKRKNNDQLSRLSKKYNISVDDLGKAPAKPIEPEVKEEIKEEMKAPKPPETEKVAEPPVREEYAPTKTQAFKQMVSDATDRDSAQYVFEELFPGIDPLTSADLSSKLPDISDIDTRVSEKYTDQDETESGATITFTPVKQDGTGKSHISISSTTRQIDITGEFGLVPNEEIDDGYETELENGDFDDFNPKLEYSSPEDSKKLVRRLSLKKRSAFFKTVLTGFISVLLALFLIPSIAELFVAHTFVCACICEGLFLAAVLINMDMFLSLSSVVGKRCTSDCIAVLSSIGALTYGAVAITIPHDASALIILASVILFVRSLSCFWDASFTLSNLKQITNPNPKKAVMLIEDHATSFAMAKNAIDGDALIAAGQKTDFVADFMKYSRYQPELGGKLRIVFFVTLFLAVMVGLGAGSFFGELIIGFKCLASILCIAAAPALFLTDTLPLMSASTKLNRKGAMIAGKAGALKLEVAYSAVISSGDIFPDGTVTLHSMKVLADNDIDRTILRAASLTDSLGSTLSPIFKRIAGTNSDYIVPDSDTVKYEEKLGISGWVDNELLFIGNRTLMEAHGIDVPSIELDRKILRQGYFPVYLASGDTACALMVIQYNVDPDVSRELRRLTNLGITLLVNNCDPNISEAMICDYIGLYEDSVKIMTNAGVHMYQAAVTPTVSCSAPAAFRTSALTFVSILNCASRIKRSSLLLTVSYIITACIGAIVFSYAVFMGGLTAPSGIMVILYDLIATALSIILYLTQKP